MSVWINFQVSAQPYHNVTISKSKMIASLAPRYWYIAQVYLERTAWFYWKVAIRDMQQKALISSWRKASKHFQKANKGTLNPIQPGSCSIMLWDASLQEALEGMWTLRVLHIHQITCRSWGESLLQHSRELFREIFIFICTSNQLHKSKLNKLLAKIVANVTSKRTFPWLICLFWALRVSDKVQRVAEYFHAHYISIKHTFLVHIPVELFAPRHIRMGTYPLLPYIFIELFCVNQTVTRVVFLNVTNISLTQWLTFTKLTILWLVQNCVETWNKIVLITCTSINKWT